MNFYAISPLDGRYGAILEPLRLYVSDFALTKYRVQVEVEWLIFLSECPEIEELPSFSKIERQLLLDLVEGFSSESMTVIRNIEGEIGHDVKAVEYFVKERLRESTLAPYVEFVHFGCTSEDINSLAYALMMRDGVTKVWCPLAAELIEVVTSLAIREKATPMLSHTHGQPATPTTVGKELAVFVSRWQKQWDQVNAQQYWGKFSGAVGNYNAHLAAYPELAWEEINRRFIESFGLCQNSITTQIEPHDYLAECFHSIIRFNNILLDFVCDMWSYISLGYFQGKAVSGQVGSSTMPHKVNPIDFENAEANIGLGNALLNHLANKLPVSRLQRDLSDSSALRNIGSCLAYTTLALHSTLKGLLTLRLDREALKRDLSVAWEVLGEAVQTVMRKAGYDKPYEMLKQMTRGMNIDEQTISSFILGLELPKDDKDRLLAMRPETYIGLAEHLAEISCRKIQ